MEHNYPFLDYINEDKSKYPTASSMGYIDPDDDFLIGESGGFLLNIRKGYKFVNTELLYETGKYYERHSKYTPYSTDSVLHRQFRLREEDRRNRGFAAPIIQTDKGEIINGRITGGHYHLLNYYKMEQLDESSIKKGTAVSVAEKTVEFAKFIDAQYWTYKCMEFCKNNGFNLIIDKTRRGGFSHIMASETGNTVNLKPKKSVINVAIDKKYLTQKGGLTDFAINHIDFLETETPFKRGIVKRPAENFILGYKNIDGTTPPQSWGSAVLSVSAQNNPDCAIGKDAIRINVEELSTMDNFDQFMEVTEPTTRTGSYSTGTIYAWGTATNANMQVFESNFYDPKSRNFMPFENVWDKDSRDKICGYFKAYAWGLQGIIDGTKAMDKDGNSDLEVSLRIAFKERKHKEATAKNYAEYCNYLGQYALYPAESFSAAIDNIFSDPRLNQWEERLRLDNPFKFYTDGMLVENGKGIVEWKSNELLVKEGAIYGKDVFNYITGVPIQQAEHHHGCIRMWYHPQTSDVITDKGIVKEVPIGMYSISYDPVGVDKEQEQITYKHSHNSIKVWMNPCAQNGFKPRLCASYYGRPSTLEEADKICLLLAKYFNCVRHTNVEVNRGETVSNFKKWKVTKYLSRRPLYLWADVKNGKEEGDYGYVISDGRMKLDALRLLKELLYSKIGEDENGNEILYLYTISDYQSILELKKWTPKGNYDRVSEMLIRAIEWAAMDAKSKKILEYKPVNKYNDFFSRDWF